MFVFWFNCYSWNIFAIVVGGWVLGGRGEICDNVCQTFGRKCDSEIQSKLTQPMDLGKAMMEAGVYCRRLAGPRSYAGTPFYSGGTCVYITDGAKSVCNGNRVPHHQPLCYCIGKLES